MARNRYIKNKLYLIFFTDKVSKSGTKYDLYNKYKNKYIVSSNYFRYF